MKFVPVLSARYRIAVENLLRPKFFSRSKSWSNSSINRQAESRSCSCSNPGDGGFRNRVGSESAPQHAPGDEAKSSSCVSEIRIGRRAYRASSGRSKTRPLWRTKSRPEGSGANDEFPLRIQCYFGELGAGMRNVKGIKAMLRATLRSCDPVVCTLVPSL